MKSVLFFAGLVLVIASCGEQKTDETTTEQTLTTQPTATSAPATAATTSTTTTKVAPLMQKVDYVQIWETNKKRDDHAKYFIVVMPAVKNQETDSSYKAMCRHIVASIANKEKTKKFSVDILDDTKAAKGLMASEYGANTVGRPITPEESDFFAKHIVGSYIGEYAVLKEKYELEFYNVSKYGSREVFEPIVK